MLFYMENKKSFILYADLISVVNKLIKKDRENKTNYAGELFLIILEYVNDLNPIAVDFIVEMAFEPIKLQLKRDLVKWVDFREKQAENGRKGGRPPKPKPLEGNPKNPSLLSETQKSLNVTDTVNVNDTYLKEKEVFEKLQFELHNCHMWHQDICRNNQMNIQKLKQYLIQFCKKLQDEKDFYKETPEYQKYFARWLKVQIQKDKDKVVVSGYNPREGLL